MYNKLNTKVNNLEKRMPGTTTLIHTNQCSTDKQIFREKTEDVDKKYQIREYYVNTQ